jgi:hypothetical protein
MHGAKTRYGVGSIGDAKLAAKRGRGDVGVMVRSVYELRIGDCTQQVAHKSVEFRISDEMRRLLLAKRSA